MGQAEKTQKLQQQQQQQQQTALWADVDGQFN